MKKLILSLLLLPSLVLAQGTGTPPTLRVRTDANGYLIVAPATQTNPITQGTFSTRVLKTDASGNLLVVLTGTVTPTYPLSIPASTCAAPSLGLSGAATTGIAFTATPSILNCIAGTAVTTLISSSFTSTVSINGPNGTVSAPTFAGTGTNSNTGFFYPTDDHLAVAINGASSGYFAWATDASYRIQSGAFIAWMPGADLLATPVLTLWKSELGNDWIEQRRSTNPQRASWANTYTSSVNKATFDIDMQTSAGIALVGTRTAATGTGFPLRLVAQANNGGALGYLQINTSGSISTNGTTPAVSNTSADSCGTTAATIAGNDNTGIVTVGDTAGTSCTITFVTAAPNRRQCQVTNETTANLVRARFSSTTVSILEGTFVAGDVLAYNCNAY